MVIEKIYTRIYLSKPMLRWIIQKSEEDLVSKASQVGLASITLFAMLMAVIINVLRMF